MPHWADSNLDQSEDEDELADLPSTDVEKVDDLLERSLLILEQEDDSDEEEEEL